jgi:hypothetical protein
VRHALVEEEQDALAVEDVGCGYLDEDAFV